LELGSDAVKMILADLDTAPIEEPLRAGLKFLRAVTKQTVTADDVRAAYAAGVTRVQLDEALAVAFAFNTIDRLADTFEFHVGPPASFESSAKMLLKRGYKM
jgi:hypothetical protein